MVIFKIIFFILAIGIIWVSLDTGWTGGWILIIFFLYQLFFTDYLYQWWNDECYRWDYEKTECNEQSNCKWNNDENSCESIRY